MSLKVELIPFSKDNYSFYFEDPITHVSCVVDPGSSQVLIDYLTPKNKSLDYILNTHHHTDHIGGNLELKYKYQCKIIGNARDAERIPGIDIKVFGGDSISIGNLKFNVLNTYGHTVGHIAYYNEEHQILFCGDTLFSVGCGRIFEGTPQQMLESLNRLKSLPEETKIYCAHEYTLSNIQFAQTIDPNNMSLQNYKDQVIALRESNTPTIPTDIKTQKQVNPFLSLDSTEIRKNLTLESATDLEVFTKLRSLKDNF